MTASRIRFSAAAGSPTHGSCIAVPAWSWRAGASRTTPSASRSTTWPLPSSRCAPPDARPATRCSSAPRVWLARQQDHDRGFGFSTRGAGSDVDATAAAVQALVGAGQPNARPCRGRSGSSSPTRGPTAASRCLREAIQTPSRPRGPSRAWSRRDATPTPCTVAAAALPGLPALPPVGPGDGSTDQGGRRSRMPRRSRPPE